MWPFGKKHKDLASLFSEEHMWHVMAGQIDGRPSTVRLNDSAMKYSGHPDLPIKLAFAIPANEAHPGEILCGTELEQMSIIEDQIISRVEGPKLGLHVLSITNDMMREIVFYVKPGLDIQQLHLSIDESVPSHEVQCIAQKESIWETFEYFYQIKKKTL